MKTDIQTIKDSFLMGYNDYEPSIKEAQVVWDFYHNRQWSQKQLNTLADRGQPAETFNIIKTFARMLIGYYSTVVNRIRIEPSKFENQTLASLLTDVVNATFEQNKFDIEGDKLKLSAIVAGIMVCEVTPVDTGKRDRFGRPIYRIQIRHVNDYEVVLDSLSTQEHYEDARFLHRFRWVTEETIVKLFGKEALKKLEAFYNTLDVTEADFFYTHNTQFSGQFRVFNNYLLVHTVIVDDDNRRWNIYWSNDVILEKKEITYKDVKWPYRVVKLHTSNKVEYYGIFRDILESQKAINQAVIKLQLMVNTQKVFVEQSSLPDDYTIEEFSNIVNRVNGVIPVKNLRGIKVENLSSEAFRQYEIIDKAIDRIQRTLSINDSFLGMAYAADSGRKVKLQQNAAVMALRYLTVRLEFFFETLGRDIINLIRQYYNSEQTMRITDEITGQRYFTLNKPMEVFTGQMDANGEPKMDFVYEQQYDPENRKPLINNGNLVFAPVPQEETDISFDEVDVLVSATAYNDEDERAQLMVENVLAGNIGQMLAQINPSGFFKAAGLTLRTMKTKYSPEISRILEETAAMIGGQPVAEEGAAQLAQGLSNQQSQKPKSSGLKLPTNTNEETSDGQG